MAFHLTIFRLSGLEALEQILTRCTLHTHRSKLWAPGHQRPLIETARRHEVLIDRLAARDGAGLARGDRRAHRHDRLGRRAEHERARRPANAGDPGSTPRRSADFDFKTMPIAEARRRSDAATIPWSDGAPEIPARDITVDLGSHRMRGRLYSPTAEPLRTVIVYVHGGGWTFGSIDTHDGTMRNLAVALAHARLRHRLSTGAGTSRFRRRWTMCCATIAFVEAGGLGTPLPASALALPAIQQARTWLSRQ